MKRVAMVMPMLAFLAACDSDRRDFVASCTEDGTEKKACGCFYDKLEENLAPAEMDLLMDNIRESETADMDILTGLSMGVRMITLIPEIQRECAL